MKKFITFLIIVLIGFGIYFLITGKKGAENGTSGGEKSSSSSSSIEASSVKTFEVTGGSFAFLPKEIRVKKGDKVRILFISKDILHNWRVDEFNAKTDRVEKDGTASVEFVADKVGTFEYYCDVGQHRQNGMVGKLIVEE